MELILNETLVLSIALIAAIIITAGIVAFFIHPNVNEQKASASFDYNCSDMLNVTIYDYCQNDGVYNGKLLCTCFQKLAKSNYYRVVRLLFWKVNNTYFIMKVQ